MSVVVVVARFLFVEIILLLNNRLLFNLLDLQLNLLNVKLKNKFFFWHILFFYYNSTFSLAYLVLLRL